MTAAAEWLNSTFYNFDYSLFEFFHNVHDGPLGFIINPFLEFVTFLGKDGIILILLSLILMLFKKTRKAGAVMLFGVGFGALITNLTVKPLVARPRPYTNTEWDVYQWWINAGQAVEGDKSFPSGHTTAAMSAMTGLFFTFDKKKSWTAFIFAFLMGCSRILLCVHYPSDVLGGFVVGFVAGLLAALLINWFFENKNNSLKRQNIIDFDIIKKLKKN